MPLKKVFVLANSIKKHQRCIAGREIVRHPDGKEYWGEWIRPVTLHDEGAVSISECRLQDDTIPVPLDVIHIPITSCENNSAQPENWYIERNTRWAKIRTFTNNAAQKLIETPENLWLEPRVKQDRVTPQHLLSRKNYQSIYLIRPENFHFFVEVNSWDGVDKKRVRGIFNYNRQAYDFSMTDPLVRTKYFPDFGKVPSGKVDLVKNDDLIICVSLTPEFNGYHYKVVATVIEA